MESSASDRTAKLPVFDGKPEKFQLWWHRFEAYAAVHKFGEALEDDKDMPATAAAELNETTDKKKDSGQEEEQFGHCCIHHGF